MQLKTFFLVAGAASADPIAKVISILGDCEQKILKEGEQAQKVFSELSEWCEDRNRNVAFEIQTGKTQVEELTASIANEKSKQDALTTEIEELAASLSANEKDLSAATTVRDAEATDFASAEKELVEIIDTLNRAIGIIQREMSKGSASMMQLRSVNNLAQALNAMVSASVLSSADAERLTALVQSNQQAEDPDIGAPDAAAYENHSGDIVDTLEGLLDKAEAQLDNARKKETNAKHNYQMLKQSLEDEIKFASKEKDDAAKALSSSAEAQATAEGDLAVTRKDLNEDTDVLSTLHHDCMTGAQNFEAETKSRGEELKAIAAAKAALKENTGGAADLTYNGASFLQVGAAVEPTTQVVHFVRNLAKKQNSAGLSQLASRIASAVRLSANTGDDIFAKVKALITDMIAKLEEDSKTDASHKAYCDKELAEASQKKVDKTAEVGHLSTKIDQKSAQSAKLKDEIATLQRELAQLASAQVSMDKIRSEEKAAYKENKADLEQGLEGVKLALKVLHDYYATDQAHAAQEGVASTVIGMLEVVESDFSKGLAQTMAEEDQAEAAYAIESKKNEVTKTMKDRDVKYKTKEAAGADKAVTEYKSDRDGAQDELDAVLEYLKKLDQMCVAKPETYSERASRRKAEIDGLKEALSILESEVAFVQKKALRGVHAHAN